MDKEVACDEDSSSYLEYFMSDVVPSFAKPELSAMSNER
jgi:hypothetical protein